LLLIEVALIKSTSIAGNNRLLAVDSGMQGIFVTENELLGAGSKWLSFSRNGRTQGQNEKEGSQQIFHAAKEAVIRLSGLRYWKKGLYNPEKSELAASEKKKIFIL